MGYSYCEGVLQRVIGNVSRFAGLAPGPLPSSRIPGDLVRNSRFQLLEVTGPPNMPSILNFLSNFRLWVHLPASQLDVSQRSRMSPVLKRGLHTANSRVAAPPPALPISATGTNRNSYHLWEADRWWPLFSSLYSMPSTTTWVGGMDPISLVGKLRLRSYASLPTVTQPASSWLGSASGCVRSASPCH